MELPQKAVVQVPEEMQCPWNYKKKHDSPLSPPEKKTPEFVEIGLPENSRRELISTRLPDFPAINYQKRCFKESIWQYLRQGGVIPMQNMAMFWETRGYEPQDPEEPKKPLQIIYRKTFNSQR